MGEVASDFDLKLEVAICESSPGKEDRRPARAWVWGHGEKFRQLDP